MKITKEWLKKEGACADGFKWFIAKYPDGVDHKDLYVAAQEIDKGWGYWLLGHIGGTEFGIRCAMKVYFEPVWVQWANDWLSGKDRSAGSARAAGPRPGARGLRSRPGPDRGRRPGRRSWNR